METLTVKVTITPEQAQAILDACAAALADIVQRVKQIAAAVVETIQAALAALAANFREWLHTLLRITDPKLYHLAFHARTRRARKKNLRRLLRKLAAP